MRIRARQRAALVFMLAGWGMAPSASASPPSEAQELVADAPLLLMMVEDDELGAAIVRAVRVELNDVDVELESVGMLGPAELRGRIEAGEALVRERGALGLVWLEPRDDGLLIHLVVADAGMLRRPVVGVDEPMEAVETAAVIVRHFTTDLIAGRPIGLTRFAEAGDELAASDDPDPSENEPVVTDRADPSTLADALLPDLPPPDRPSPMLRDGGCLRFQLAYVGQAWARERSWVNGAELGLGWRAALGVHVGASFAFVPRFEKTITHPQVTGGMEYRVGRYPLSIYAGYQHVWTKLGLAVDAQVRVVTEFHARSTVEPVGDIRIEFTGTSLRVIPAIEPRLQLDYLPIPRLSVFAALGLRVALVDVEYGVSYEIEGQQGSSGVEESVLQPNLISPTLLLGVGVFL